jgi:hypothetical protein
VEAHLLHSLVQVVADLLPDNFLLGRDLVLGDQVGRFYTEHFDELVIARL